MLAYAELNPDTGFGCRMYKERFVQEVSTIPFPWEDISGVERNPLRSASVQSQLN